MTQVDGRAPETHSRSLSTLSAGRLALSALVVLGAFDVGRLIAGALIAPWLAEQLLGARTPVVVGDFDLARLAIEIVSIVIGTALAALITTPLARAIIRRGPRRWPLERPHVGMFGRISADA